MKSRQLQNRLKHSQLSQVTQQQNENIQEAFYSTTEVAISKKLKCTVTAMLIGFSCFCRTRNIGRKFRMFYSGFDNIQTLR